MKWILGRRELLKGLVPTAILPAAVLQTSPFTPKGQLWAMHPGPYMLFADPRCVDIQDLIMAPHPELSDDIVVYVIPVKLAHEQTIDDVVRIYGLVDSQRRTP